LVFDAAAPREVPATSEPEPVIEVDDSPGGTPTPPQLHDLTEPSPAFNKVEAAKRALEALTPYELREIPMHIPRDPQKVAEVIAESWSYDDINELYDALSNVLLALNEKASAQPGA
jgi:hypothetical protein